MSSGPAAAVRATISSLFGLTISSCSPLVGATHSPPMNSLSGCLMLTPSGVIAGLLVRGEGGALIQLRLGPCGAKSPYPSPASGRRRGTALAAWLLPPLVGEG